MRFAYSPFGMVAKNRPSHVDTASITPALLVTMRRTLPSPLSLSRNCLTGVSHSVERAGGPAMAVTGATRRLQRRAAGGAARRRSGGGDVADAAATPPRARTGVGETNAMSRLVSARLGSAAGAVGRRAWRVLDAPDLAAQIQFGAMYGHV
jgi:hypothetical protein